MSTYIVNGYMDNSASGTVNMLEKFDHLFDLLNSSTTKTTNQFRKPYTGTDAQKHFLKTMLCSLENMQVFSETNAGKKDVTRTFKSINGFQITTKSTMELWNDLKTQIQSLKTRRLNQDCLENFFGKIRQQGGHSVNPTPSHFISAYSKLSCMDLMDCLDTFNCSTDSDVLLVENIMDQECSKKVNQPTVTSIKVVQLYFLQIFCLILIFFYSVSFCFIFYLFYLFFNSVCFL